MSGFLPEQWGQPERKNIVGSPQLKEVTQISPVQAGSPKSFSHMIPFAVLQSLTFIFSRALPLSQLLK